MKSGIAIIGGVGFWPDGRPFAIDTPYGSVLAFRTSIGDTDLLVIPRHGERHLPPHIIDYRALVCAAKREGSNRVISINTVGTMSYHETGSLFLPVDFVEFTWGRKNTFFEGRAVHVEMTLPYCPEIQDRLRSAIRSQAIDLDEGTYVCAQGPHLESPAQIRMMRQFGDVVGMTGYPEVVLARELGLCYASLCLVTNPATGMSGQGFLAEDVLGGMDRFKEKIGRVLAEAIASLPLERSCSCSKALEGARL